MHEFTIVANEYLQQDCRAFYHTVYVRMGNPGNPDYINTLKNTFGDFSMVRLNNAAQELRNALMADLPKILQLLQLPSLTVCVVPRARAESNYRANQLLFKSTARNVINQLNDFYDGTNFIIRHTNTQTTHLRNTSVRDDGPEPYQGITANTCTISNNVNGKDVLLIDDLYTRSINIDEDAIQALLNSGVNSVSFYAIGCRM